MPTVIRTEEVLRARARARARARGGLEIVAPSLAGVSISCGGDHMILKIENAAIKPAVFVYRLAKKFLQKTVIFLAG